MSYRHVVLFRVRNGTDDGQLKQAILGLESLATLPGVVEWTIRRSDDERKGIVIVESALFESKEALAAFAADPRHRAIADQLAMIADWSVGDFEEGS